MNWPPIAQLPKKPYYSGTINGSPNTMKSLISNLLIPCLLVIQACSPTKNVQQTPSAHKSYSKVSLENLLDSMGAYQNKRIETLGYYICGFEHTCIQPEMAYQPFPDRKLYDWTQRIWVEPKGSRL